MGGYAGSSYFAVVIDPEGRVKFVEIGESKDFDFLTTQCEGSVKLLPRPQLGMLTAEKQVPVTTGSLADELEKLSKLRERGLLSEEEFQAAKKQLLERPMN
jgi:hypothetical protein